MKFFLSRDKINYFLQTISDHLSIYTHTKSEDNYNLVKTSTWDSDKHTLGAYRSVEPLKSILFRPREYLGQISKDSNPPTIADQIVIGVKNCDLSALKIHDNVFLETEPVDPFYKEAREKTIIISTDCTDCREVCFCTAVKEQPYPKTGFDINISVIESGWILESGSPKAEKILDLNKSFLSEVTEEMITERDAKRSEIFEKVKNVASKKGLNNEQDYKKAIESSFEKPIWNDFSQDCVECGACNFVCCTCHCFLLQDGFSKENLPERLKLWDSCLYKNFARVAGGANPREERADRLFNRFDKKFVFFPSVLNTYACDGCGRCIEACTGKIDIREVLKKALELK